VALRPSLEHGLARSIFGASPQASLALMREAWAQAVGPDLAERTQVLAIEGQTLRIAVPDARWHKVLHKMQRDILPRLRQLAGDMAPYRLGFQERAALARPALPPPVAPAHVMAPLPASVAASAAGITDDELRVRFEEVAARYLSRVRPN
jgi:hypothetical protein